MPKRFARDVDPETLQVMDAALGKMCEALGLVKTYDLMTESLARIIVQQAETGERDPDKLCALALAALRRE